MKSFGFVGCGLIDKVYIFFVFCCFSCFWVVVVCGGGVGRYRWLSDCFLG